MMGDTATSTLLPSTTRSSGPLGNPLDSTDFAIVTLEPLNDTFLPKNILVAADRPIKIGRKVSPKSAPEPFNGIFDAKVLSRTHAEFVYEHGAVSIRDLKSSNGTFVNGQRLSEEGVQSAPKQLSTNDILEFGIDIIDEEGKILYKKVAARVGVEYGSGNNMGTLVKGQVPTGPGPQLTQLMNMVEEETRLSTEAADVLQQIRTSFDRMDPDKGDNVSERSIRTISKPLTSEPTITRPTSKPPLSAQPSTIMENMVSPEQFSSLQEKVASFAAQLALLSEQVNKDYARLDLEGKSQFSAVQDVTRSFQQIETSLQVTVDDLKYRVKQLESDLPQKLKDQDSAMDQKFKKALEDVQDSHLSEVEELKLTIAQLEARLEQVQSSSDEAKMKAYDVSANMASLSEQFKSHDLNKDTREFDQASLKKMDALMKRLEALEAKLERTTSDVEPADSKGVPVTPRPVPSSSSQWVPLLFVASIIVGTGWVFGNGALYDTLVRYLSH